MTNLHPRYMDRILAVEPMGFSYTKTSISTGEGEFLHSQIRQRGYYRTLEVGCALGMASLYICDASSQSPQWTHTIIDPNQTTKYRGIGIANLDRLGLDRYRLLEKPSEFALPELLADGESYDLAFIDGWHTFDHTLIDFFYVNRMLRVGGMVVFDDADWPAVSRLLRYVSRYPAYERVQLPEEAGGKQKRLRNGTRRIGHFTRILPRKLRELVLSDLLLNPSEDALAISLSKRRWSALVKVEEDTRRYDWFEGL